MNIKKHLIISGKAIAFIVLWGALLSVMAISAVNEPGFLESNSAFIRLWWEFIPLCAVLLLTAAFVCLVEKNKIKVSLLTNPLRNTFWGVVLGCIWIGGAILALFLMVNITLGNKNEIPCLAVWFLAVLLNTVMQEYLVRGYLFSLLKEKYNIAVAIIITTVLFTAMHVGAFEAGAVAVLNVITMSVFVSLLLIYTKSLLAPVIVHFIWNGIGCLVFGIVSLADDYPSIWNSIMSGSNLLSGGSAKIEGSIIVLIINALLITFMVYLLKKQKAK